MTDTNEDTEVEYLYKAFGEQSILSGSHANPFTWVGQSGYYRQSDASDYWVRARVMNPTTGRWVTRDPLTQDYSAIGNSNPEISELLRDYGYCMNTPTTLIDSSGMLSIFGQKINRDYYICCMLECSLGVPSFQLIAWCGAEKKHSPPNREKIQWTRKDHIERTWAQMKAWAYNTLQFRTLSQIVKKHKKLDYFGNRPYMRKGSKSKFFWPEYAETELIPEMNKLRGTSSKLSKAMVVAAVLYNSYCIGVCGGHSSYIPDEE